MTNRLPDANHRFVLNGFLSRPARLFLDNLTGIINGTIELFYRPKSFDSLLQCQEALPNPKNNMLARFKDQGLGVYREDLQKWVKASDDVTDIT